MVDDEQGRDDKPDDRERRRRAREEPTHVDEEEPTRVDEEEPTRAGSDEQLDELDDALETHDYPTTTDELVERYGDYEIETQGGVTPLEEVLTPADTRTYDSADEVRARILRLIGRQ